MDEPDEPEFNISRLRRDTEANMTWEGTTNVLSSEVVRHVMKKGNLEIWDAWMGRAIQGVQDEVLRKALQESWTVMVEKFRGRELAEALAEGRQMMFSLAWTVSGMLMCYDAQRDGNEVAAELARRWVLDGEGVSDFVIPDVMYSTGRKRTGTETQRANWDCKVVWGVDLPEREVRGYRSEKTVELAAKL